VWSVYLGAKVLPFAVTTKEKVWKNEGEQKNNKASIINTLLHNR